MAQKVPRVILVPIIIALNAIVFYMWIQYGGDQSPYMNANFAVSYTALQEGRWWTLLTSIFSHQAWWHIFLNMTVLNSFGSLLEQVLGRKRFLAFYIVAGLVGSLCHCLVSAFILGTPDVGAVGASGAIAGLILLFSLLFPKEKLLLFFVIPVPAFWGAIVFVSLDLFGLFAQSEGSGLPIGHGAHLGGALTGILFYFLYLRRYVRHSHTLI